MAPRLASSSPRQTALAVEARAPDAEAQHPAPAGVTRPVGERDRRVLAHRGILEGLTVRGTQARRLVQQVPHRGVEPPGASDLGVQHRREDHWPERKPERLLRALQAIGAAETAQDVRPLTAHDRVRRRVSRQRVRPAAADQVLGGPRRIALVRNTVAVRVGAVVGDPAVKIDHERLGAARVGHRVHASPGGEEVGAGAAVKRVVPFTAGQGVVAGTAHEAVGQLVARQFVPLRTPNDVLDQPERVHDVGDAVTVEILARDAAEIDYQRGVACRIAERVVSLTTAQGIAREPGDAAVAGLDHVVALQGLDVVRATVSDQTVGTLSTPEALDVGAYDVSLPRGAVQRVPVVRAGQRARRRPPPAWSS